MQHLSNFNGLSLLLIAVAILGLIFGWCAMRAYEQADQREQQYKRELEHYQRVLYQAVSVGMDYDRALLVGDGSIRPLLALKLKAITRQTYADTLGEEVSS